MQDNLVGLVPDRPEHLVLGFRRIGQHLQGLVDQGNTVVVVEHDMRAIAEADWVMDLGPGAGDMGGHIVASGTPQQVADHADSITAPYLRAALQGIARDGGRKAKA